MVVVHFNLDYSYPNMKNSDNYDTKYHKIPPHSPNDFIYQKSELTHFDNFGLLYGGVNTHVKAMLRSEKAAIGTTCLPTARQGCTNRVSTGESQPVLLNSQFVYGPAFFLLKLQ